MSDPRPRSVKIDSEMKIGRPECPERPTYKPVGRPRDDADPRPPFAIAFVSFAS
jgi:hypothetical protein